MVKKIPVRASDQANVRLQDQHATSWPKERVYDPQLFDYRFTRRKVLEVVAHEDQVEVRTGKDSAEGKTVGCLEAHRGREILADVPEVDGPALRGSDVADEASTVTGDVENTRVNGNEALEIVRDFSPHASASHGILIAETICIQRR
jgi:hypothetical protein